MDNGVYKDALKNLANKSELEKTVSVGIQGPPQIKLEEKMHHLGVFRERILVALTKGQVMRNTVYPEISEALSDQRSTKMLVHGDIDFRFSSKYQKAAAQAGKHFTIVHDPNLRGDVGLVIASDKAVDIEYIHIDDEKPDPINKP